MKNPVDKDAAWKRVVHSEERLRRSQNNLLDSDFFEFRAAAGWPYMRLLPYKLLLWAGVECSSSLAGMFLCFIATGKSRR